MICDFMVWLRTGSYPADINWVQIHTGIKIPDTTWFDSYVKCWQIGVSTTMGISNYGNINYGNIHLYFIYL